MNVAMIGSGAQTSATGQTTRRSAPTEFAAALDSASVPQADDDDDVKTAARRAIAAFDLTRVADPSAIATYAEGARQVSIAQGLPGGTYDFTRITPRQMTIVGGAMMSGGTVGAAGMAGVLDLAGQASALDTPVNFFAYLSQQAKENEKAPGGMNTAFQQKTSLSVLTRLQSEQGVPITYDDNYPTAPRVLTAEEINTNLKNAIVAFTKEASLTPAQRIRRDVLKDMKMTEDDLKAMPQAEREAAEKKIGEEVARRLTMLGLSNSDSRQRTDAAATDTLTPIA